MELTGEKIIAVAPTEVFAALNDPEILKKSIPGCVSLAKKSATEFVAQVGLKIGPVSATFDGKVTLSDLNPPHGYKLTGEGTSSSAGFAKGSTEIKLEEHEQGTKLSYQAKAEVGGKIAQLGSRLIDSTAKSLAEKFFKNFQAAVGKPEETEELQSQAAAKTKLLKPHHWKYIAIGAIILLVSFGLLRG